MAGFGQEIQTYSVYFSFKLKNRSGGEAARQAGPERLSRGPAAAAVASAVRGSTRSGRVSGADGHGGAGAPHPDSRGSIVASSQRRRRSADPLQRAVSDGQLRVTAAISQTIHTPICYLLICFPE